MHAAGLEQHKIIRRQFDWKEFACGWGAAVINITVTYPLNKVIIRQVCHGDFTIME